MPPKSKRDWSKPPMRAYEPGKRHMELIPSVSRSSGLDKDGDAYVQDHLTSHSVGDAFQLPG